MAYRELYRLSNSIKLRLYMLMPYNPNRPQRKDRPYPHIRDYALGNNDLMPIGSKQYQFNIGNDDAEENAPYYHILEDAEVIRKSMRGTKTSKGSQDSILNKRERDYGIQTEKVRKSTGETYTVQEYRKNRRGARSLAPSSQHYQESHLYKERLVITNAQVINADSNYYLNYHYNYIERQLDSGMLQSIASELNLTLKRGWTKK